MSSSIPPLKMHLNGTWDIRVTPELCSFFITLRKKGNYYWKLSNDECLELIRLLCAAYNISSYTPEFSTKNVAKLREEQCCGLCEYRSQSGNYHCEIFTFPRPHFKTVAHEVYHHIDFYYRYKLRTPTYNSSDAKKYAWNFAEHLWNACVKAAATPSGRPVTTGSGKGKGKGKGATAGADIRTFFGRKASPPSVLTL